MRCYWCLPFNFLYFRDLSTWEWRHDYLTCICLNYFPHCNTSSITKSSGYVKVRLIESIRFRRKHGAVHSNIIYNCNNKYQVWYSSFSLGGQWWSSEQEVPSEALFRRQFIIWEMTPVFRVVDCIPINIYVLFLEDKIQNGSSEKMWCTYFVVILSINRAWVGCILNNALDLKSMPKILG